MAENGKILSESDRFSFDREITIGDIDIDFIISERLKNNSFGFSKTNSDFRIIEISLISNPVDNLERKLNKTPFIPANDKERDSVCSEISNLQATALARRFLHTNANSAVIGISGGLDSTLALLSTIKAFEKINKPLKDIIAINMPGFGTTNKTKSNAEKLAEEFGVTFKSISINDSVNQHFKDISHDDKIHDITYENAQARMRTMILMDIANQSNGLVIGTGDLSEIALGWNTFNGDQMSMYGLNSGVPKSLVKYIIKWYAEKVYNGNISDILTDILNTPVSPELLPLDKEGNNPQETEKTIGPYILHDFFLYNFIRCSFSPQKVQFLANIAFKDEYSAEEIEKWLKIFIKRFFSQQFKRNSMPDGTKIGTVSLSQRADWRMPSDIKYESWLNDINSGVNNAV